MDSVQPAAVPPIFDPAADRLEIASTSGRADDASDKRRFGAALGADRGWLVVMAACTAIELAWWTICWFRGLAPLPMVGTYAILAAAALAAAFAVRSTFASSRSRASLTSIAVGFVLVVVGASLFLPLKFAIPREIPFWLDQPLARFEAAPLGGVHPWMIVDRLVGRLAVPFDRIYGLWLPIQSVILFSVMLEPQSPAKSRALAAYAVAWLGLGVVAAVLLSSAGPIFYDRLFGGSTFGELRPMLETRGAWVGLAESDAMWASYQHNRPTLVAGMSAMPSMHVAISLWIYLTARDMAPRAAPAALAYTGIVWLASVQLGWHYVSDGAVGIIGMLAIWAAVSAFFRDAGATSPARP